jgi:hypothetical protein
VHTAPVVTYKMAVRQFRIIEHQETLKKEWKRAVRTLSTGNFDMAFRQWYERCKKFVKIAGS